MLEQEKYIFDAVEIIDAGFEKEGIELSTRPLMAAMAFVKHFVGEVENGDKENPWNEPWFAVIYHHVIEWYQQAYGAALESDKHSSIGVVIIRSLPYILKVPNTRREIEADGDGIWVIFPSSVDEEENSIEWVVNPPNIDKLSNESMADLNAQIYTVASAMRQIQLNINTSKNVDKNFSGFISGIQTELESAATNIAKNTQDSLQIAAWSIQMALERTLKAISIQKRGTFRESHDLFILFDDLGPMENVASRELLKRLPRHKQVISARYGQGPNLMLFDLVNSYMAAIEFIRLSTTTLEREIRMSNARFHLKKAPWLATPDEGAASNRESN